MWVSMTENAEYKLDGLILTIEGAGRDASGKPALQAFGDSPIFRRLSYDDATSAYHFRTFNDGRYLETEPQVDVERKRMTWSFSLGEIKTSSILQLDEHGNWTEVHNVTIGAQPPRKFMELSVTPQK